MNDPVEKAKNSKKWYVSWFKNNELICEKINAVNPIDIIKIPSDIPRNFLKFVA